MSNTPLNDFLTRLAEPEYLESFKSNPLEVLNQTILTEEQKTLVLSENRGLLRVRAIQELEKAGFAPLVSDQFSPNSSDLPPINMTINTNNFNTTNININTTVTMNTNTTNTTNENTTTTTTNDSRDWLESAVDLVESAIRYFETNSFDLKGSLVVVGGGIKPISDMTLGAEAQIRSAEKVLYCVADPVTERRIHSLNQSAESLYGLYANDKPRVNTYVEMLQTILDNVRSGLRTCVVFYGHPGIYAWATHQAIRISREEGYRAEMMPGISAEASLFADLGIDPSSFGCQSFDATDLLIRKRTIDPTCHVMIWQVECVGDSGFNFSGYQKHNFPILIEELLKIYPDEHPVIIYDASQFPHLPPQIQKLQLATISKEDLSGISTLYLPPVRTPVIDLEMVQRLGLHP